MLVGVVSVLVFGSCGYLGRKMVWMVEFCCFGCCCFCCVVEFCCLEV